MQRQGCSAAVKSHRWGRWCAARKGARLAAAAAIAAGVALLAVGMGTARAQGTEVAASVVALDHGDLVIDLSTSSGATVGALVELWRPLKLKHPVTGKLLADRFRIGTLRLTQVGESLSLATAAEQLQRAPQPGDVVILRGATAPVRAVVAPVAKSTTPPVRPTGTSTAVVPVLPAPADSSGPGAGGQPVIEADPEARLLSEMFDALRGADLVTRIRSYEQYVRAKPEGRFSRVLYEEAQSLRQLLSGSSGGSKAAEGALPEVAQFVRPEVALANTPLQIGIEVKGPTAGAVLHIRKQGDSAFASFPMTPSGRSYFSVALPGERIQAPAQEYFIEAVKPDGTTSVLIGLASRPERVEVEALPVPTAPKTHRYHATIWTDYADYNRLRHNDWASQTEGYAGMRFGDVGVRALRSGFGVYRGAGGTKQDLDVLNLSSRATGLTYGYLETEIGASHFVSFIGRAVVGLRDTGTSGGAQVLIRIGNDRKTNLQLGGELLGGIGMRSITQLEFNSFERVPILLRTEVTNQPAGMSESKPTPTDAGKSPEETSKGAADVGVRAIVQVGYRIIPELTISLRGSYQGRDIKHAGPGVGAGITYEW